MRRTALFISVLILLSAGVTFFYQKTQKADINYYLGRRYFEEGVYGKAISFYKNALAIDPARIDALVGLAYSYQWTGNKEKAIELFKKALTFRKDDDLKSALAQSYAWAGEYKEAINIYEEMDAAAGNPEIKKELAQVYIWDRQFDKAKNILMRLLAVYPDDRTAKLLLAKALQYSGEPLKAAGIYEEILNTGGEK